MRIKTYFKYFIYTFIIIITFLTWLIFSNSGVKIFFILANKFTQNEVIINNISGNLYKGFTLKNVVIINRNQTDAITVEKFSINWKLNQLLSNKIIQIKSLEIHNLNGLEKHFFYDPKENTKSFPIKEIMTSGNIILNKNNILINFDKIIGFYNNYPLSASLYLQYSNNIITPYKSSKISINNNVISINCIKEDIKWDINIHSLQDILPNTKGKIISNGFIKPSKNFITIAAQANVYNLILKLPSNKIKAEQVNVDIETNDKPNSILKLNIASKHINIDKFNIQNLTSKFTGSLQEHNIITSIKTDIADINAKIYGSSILNTNPLKPIKNILTFNWEGKLTDLKINGNKINSWRNFDPINIKVNKNSLKIDNFNLLPLRKSSNNSKIKDNNLTSYLNLSSENNNYIIGNINIHNIIANSNEQKINASFKVHVNDLYLLNYYITDLNNLNGKLYGEATLNGKLAQPNFIAKITGTEIGFFVPKTGAVIKSLNFDIKSKTDGKFQLSGNGIAGGKFSLSGYMSPFEPECPNEIKISGKNLNILNIEDVTANISPDISLKLNKNSLDINGYIFIDNANINLESKFFNQSSTSSDIKYIKNNKIKNPSNVNNFTINPNITIKAKENCKVHGFDFHGETSTGIKINKQHGKIVADGRITIKKGYYKIANSKYKIKRGRLIYTPGTLLSNPKLDIKMHAKSSSINTNTDKIEQEDSGIYVNGSLKDPKIDLYSDTDKDDSDIVNPIGANSNSDNKKITKALNAASSEITEKIKEKLILDEIRLDSLQAQTYGNSYKRSNDAEETVLVLGKKLHEKLYIQYINSLYSSSEENISSKSLKKVKLKFKLNKNLNLSVEHGTNGSGCDFGFVIEK